MSNFLSYFLMFGGTVGLFLGAMCSVKCRHWYTRVLATLCIACVIGAVFGGMTALDEQTDQDLWNDGYCECGGEYQLVSVTQTKTANNKTFYWACNECGCTIQTTRRMK